MTYLDSSKKRRLFALCIGLLAIFGLIPLISPENAITYSMTILMIILIFVVSWIVTDFVRDWIYRVP